MFIQKLATFMEFSRESYRLEFRVKSSLKHKPKGGFCCQNICIEKLRFVKLALTKIVKSAPNA